jgi:hypothetical protein
MTALILTASAVVVATLAAVAFGPSLLRAMDARRSRRRGRPEVPSYDPGRERRAERRARELLRSVVSGEEYAMYAELGFVAIEGGEATDGAYGYLIYPHRPIVAFDTETGELLSEYCVGFPDLSDPSSSGRLPDADDVLAKWMTLHGSERELISAANMHVPGWHVDPGQVRRDLRRLREWRAGRPTRTADPVAAGTER